MSKVYFVPVKARVIRKLITKNALQPKVEGELKGALLRASSPEDAESSAKRLIRETEESVEITDIGTAVVWTIEAIHKRAIELFQELLQSPNYRKDTKESRTARERIEEKIAFHDSQLHSIV